MRHLNSTLATLTASALLCTPVRAGDLSSLARELGSVARSAGLRRVAIARIEPARGSDDGRGEALAEGLIVALVRDGRVQAVERGQLGKLAEEISLDRSGAVTGTADRDLRLAPIDGLIVGRYDVVDGRMRVFARVVDAQSGVIVGAADADLDASASGVADESLRDAPAEPARANCADNAARATALQQDVLDLKARYWAFRLKLGEDVSAATDSAQEAMPETDQRELFAAQLDAWRAAGQIPPMKAEELYRLSSADRHARALLKGCGAAPKS